jgi:uncharacterized RDD family membrane protein YckC/ribosomal protein L40E
MEQKSSGDPWGDIQKQHELNTTPPVSGPIDADSAPVQIPAPQLASSSASMPPSSDPGKICPACGTTNPDHATFCLKCGVKIPDLIAPDKKICSGCRAENPLTAEYCYKCGLKLPEKAGVYQAQMQYAGFGSRFAAFLINGITVSIIGFFFTIIIIGAAFDPQVLDDMNTTMKATGKVTPEAFTITGIFFLTFFAVSVLYSTLCIGLWGKTVGKMALKLKVVKPDGSKVSILRALVRSLAYLLNYCTFFLSFLVIAFTREKRGLHDYIADTIVIKTN